MYIRLPQWQFSGDICGQESKVDEQGRGVIGGRGFCRVHCLKHKQVDKKAEPSSKQTCCSHMLCHRHGVTAAVRLH